MAGRYVDQPARSATAPPGSEGMHRFHVWLGTRHWPLNTPLHLTGSLPAGQGALLCQAASVARPRSQSREAVAFDFDGCKGAHHRVQHGVAGGDDRAVRVN